MRDTAGMTSDVDAAPTVTRRDDTGRYELDVGGEVVAFAEFSAGGDVMTIPYIETAVAQRNNGGFCPAFENVSVFDCGSKMA